MSRSTRLLVCAGALLAAGTQSASVCFAQQKAAPAKVKPRPAKPRTAAAPPKPQRTEVLTNAAVIDMVRAGMGEAAIIAAIEASPARFELDGDHLVQLNQGKVPRAVIRAMLKKPAAVAPEPPAAQTQATKAEPPATPPPAVPAAVPANLDRALVRQGATSFPLTDRPQKVVFVKTESGDAKDAIAGLLLSDVGLSLITMGLAPQMKMWNPYFGDTLSKVTTLGKGLLHSRGTNTKGFEYEMLSGTTADVTLREGKPELLIPMNRHLASANVDMTGVKPVLLKLETRENDQARLIGSRQVLLKQTKKGRFDFKPTIDRQELDVQQAAIPIDVELTSENVFRITPKEDLRPGEYALVFRRQSDSGEFTVDMPLRPGPAGPQQPDMTTAGMMTPPAQPQGLAGLLGGPKPMQPTDLPQAEQGAMAGFIAWDFRVLK